MGAGFGDSPGHPTQFLIHQYQTYNTVPFGTWTTPHESGGLSCSRDLDPILSLFYSGGNYYSSWKDSHLPADVYEIQLADSATAKASAIYTTPKLNAAFGSGIVLLNVLPSTTYYVSGRSHVGWAFLTSRALGAETWGNIGPIISCTTGK